MKIFISHIFEEKTLALEFKKWIESTFLDQLAVFVSSDPKNIPAGNRWLEEITSALQESKLLIILYSPLSKIRPWINFEAGCGWIKEIPIIPICHSGLKLNQIGEPISSFQGLEIDGENFADKFFGAIAKHSGFPQYPKIDKNQFLQDIQNSLKTFNSSVAHETKQSKIKLEDNKLSEPDILALLTSHLNSSAVELNMKAIRYTEIDNDLGIPSGSTKKYIKQIVERWHYYPNQEGEEFIIFEKQRPKSKPRGHWMSS